MRLSRYHRTIHIVPIISTVLFVVLVVVGHTAAQSLPQDVELIDNNGETATSNLAMPFNNGAYGHPFPPQGVVLDPHHDQQFRPAFRASATLVGDNAEAGPMGKVVFTQHPLGNPLLVTINATGLPPGKHAVHIHAFGDLKEGCKSTGPHLRHILIGNVEVKEDGKLEINFHSPYLTLFGPTKGIVGRSIVIHEKPIEYNRFPDIRGYPIVPTLNDQNVQTEEMTVGGIIGCGIITITDN